MYLDYMDQGHYNVDDVKRAKAAADGSCWAKWMFLEKRISKAIDEIADNMGF